MADKPRRRWPRKRKPPRPRPPIESKPIIPRPPILTPAGPPIMNPRPPILTPRVTVADIESHEMGVDGLG